MMQTQAYNPATFLKTKDTQDDVWAAENIDFVRVLPDHEQRPTTTIFVVGSTRTTDGTVQAPFCVYFLTNTGSEAYVDTTRYACRNTPTAVHSTTHATVCLDNDYTQVVPNPLTGGTEVRLETLRAYASGGAIFDWTVTSTCTYHITRRSAQTARH